MSFEYICGENVTKGHNTRLYRDGDIGKVVRTPVYAGGDNFGEPRTKYFDWNNDEKEFDSIEELRQSDE